MSESDKTAIDLPPRLKLGRRPGEPVTREAILDAAELEFADGGYDNTSMRRLSERAGVSQALIVYYFGSKDALFEAVFQRRVEVLSRERLERLDALEQRSQPATVEDIIHAYLAPVFETMSEPGGRAFMQIQSQIQSGQQTPMVERLREHYDEAAARYVKALQKILPDVPPTEIYWRMSFSIGALLYNASGTARVEKWSLGACRPADLQELQKQLTKFLAAGMRA